MGELMKRHVMVDLETLGTTPGCAILSIGAVRFYPETGTLGSEFYTTIELSSCLSFDLKIEADTFYWWIKQSDQARKALGESPRFITDVLDSFRSWILSDTLLWSHGSSFDLAMLSAAYRATSLVKPWDFRNERDTRTLLAHAGMKMPKSDNCHHALWDAKDQAKTIMKAMEKIGYRE